MSGASSDLPLFVFFGAESEYVLHPLFAEMARRGFDCVELHAEPGRSIAQGLARTIAHPGPKALVTSAHFAWDERYMMTMMEVPDCPALLDIVGRLKPGFIAYYPHDLSQPMLADEARSLGLVDLFLAPGPAERMFAHRTRVAEVGWIKTPENVGVPQERWGRALWLTMSLEYIIVEYGLEKTLQLIEPWLRDWVSIKFAPFVQFEPLEGILRERGVAILDRNMTPPEAARHFDFVVTNGESSVVRESALMGVPTFLVTDVSLFGKRSRRNLWQFADLENVHVVRKLEDIPGGVSHTPPRLKGFDMDAAIEAIVSGCRAKACADRVRFERPCF